MAFVCPSELIDLAHVLADAGQPIARKYFRNDDMAIEIKSAHDPVTIADREIEKEWRRIIAEKRPKDGIWGEEFGRSNEKSEWTWIFDPIDGTKVFTLGRATFGCMIGLHHKQHGFILGLIDQPIVNLRWFGAKGCGATLNGKKLQTKTPLYTVIRSSINNLSRLPDALKILNEQMKREVHFIAAGGDCMNYAGLADGSIHYYFDTDQMIYDIAAAIPIIEEAGGKLTNLDGSAIELTLEHKVIGACTSELYDDVLSRYRKIVG
jgi:inositol-phosphate phosphatase/L-galactose 1-phosphate phosphatase/histidinol-phosphatase